MRLTTDVHVHKINTKSHTQDQVDVDEEIPVSHYQDIQSLVLLCKDSIPMVNYGTCIINYTAISLNKLTGLSSK